MKMLQVVSLLLLASTAGLACANASSSTDWPCVQRRVPEITLATVWSGPELAQDSLKLLDDPEINEVVERIASRRTNFEEARKIILDFKDRVKGRERQVLPALMVGVVENLNRERSAVIEGIERYARRQEELADKIRAQSSKVDHDRSASRISSEGSTEEEELLWETRVFEDRQRSLTAVCEVPVLIDQRLFQLARIIHGAITN
ncbi:hypothetical protein FHS85_003634 [Rhodoligotrophos appendicifer]|uniref:hypothetical protein n=1 Tax=Rhodoligotrophos appendicifer TaxID=987056 RepID=UPI0011847B43|nr:hypothetical protein [Rhodoligotrophos appendicifer]